MIYFGDIHNHNGLGYGKGSLERSIDIARSHLDFFAFTGHSSWHDMPSMEGGREQNWIEGFGRLEAAWPVVQRLTAEANAEGEFVTFLGFEWHSSAFGDQCVLFPDDFRDRATPGHIDDLRQFCREEGALMLPHHLSYPKGHRGVNWDVFNEELTPVVEIFSEHGCSEHDRAPYDYFNHSMGPRVTANTVQAGLQSGKRFGFTASSDSHRGFPGGWDEGVTAVHANGLNRADILDAIRARRTYALTGDRIRLDFSVGGARMGSTIECAGDADVRFNVEARDEIDLVEIIQDGQIAGRFWPRGPREIENRFELRIEWGWGPWLDMDLDRVADWEFTIGLDGGEILDTFPCFRSGPFDEQRRHGIVSVEEGLGVRSYSGRRGAYRGNPNHAVVLSASAGTSDTLIIDVLRPGRVQKSFTIGDLLSKGQAIFTGPYPAECMLVHRPVTPSETRLDGWATLAVGGRPSYAYLRVRQKNGQMAWSSPVFMNYP